MPSLTDSQLVKIFKMWKRGDKVLKIVRVIGISKDTLRDILSGKRACYAHIYEKWGEVCCRYRKPGDRWANRELICQRIADILADGKPHSLGEIQRCYETKGSDIDDVKVQMSQLRKLLRPRGEDIAFVHMAKRRVGYQWIRLKESMSSINIKELLAQEK